jgi:hypothetical protein
MSWMRKGQDYNYDSGIPIKKTDRHDIADILLKVALNTITQPIKKRKTKNKHTYVNLLDIKIHNLIIMMFYCSKIPQG